MTPIDLAPPLVNIFTRMSRYKYSEADLIKAVRDSISIFGVMRLLGIRLTGGSHSHIKRRIDKAGIDLSHFLGQAWGRGQNLGPKRGPDDILIKYPDDHRRTNARLLRRALKEIGIIEECTECNVKNTYNGKPIRLHIDHKNGDFTDCRADNLQFLCPNCHSQTENFGNKKSKI